MAASPRDRILASTSHETLDRLPADHWGTGKVTGMPCCHLGCEDALEMYKGLGIGGIVGVGTP